jgi:16S rRNA (guanine1207-N2)-methyltransferase
VSRTSPIGAWSSFRRKQAVYGFPPTTLSAADERAVQVSPLVVGAEGLEDLADGSLERFLVLAPPGVLERRYLLAQALRALWRDAELIALAPKAKGGSRLAAELTAFGCEVYEIAKRHHRICRCVRPASPVGLEAAIAEGGPQFVEKLGLWSQPGVFSWDRLDPGSALLRAQAWSPHGAGADFGCGLGVLSLDALKSPHVGRLTLVDIDARAVAAARRNVTDRRAAFLQADLRTGPVLADLDFVITNPPFHDGGAEDRALGRAFVYHAANALKEGGVLRMVANVALPYEATLALAFREWRQIGRDNGYKVLEAVK